METKVPRLLRVREVARLTGLAPWRLYELLARGEGPPVLRIGRTLRIPETALIAWIEEQAKTSKKEKDRATDL